jgi:predicted house-cleaning noncanonical NTP pyrophosphatase (MazG superfamily)
MLNTIINNPVKLIRTKKAHRLLSENKLKEEELSTVFIDTYGIDEFRELLILKIKEELEEVKFSRYRDIDEFADLVEAVRCLATLSNISIVEILYKADAKRELDGDFIAGTILKNLNPNNPSNKIYFENP